MKIELVEKEFKTKDGETVNRDCFLLTIENTTLELVLDPGISSDLYEKAVQQFITALQTKEDSDIKDKE